MDKVLCVGNSFGASLAWSFAGRHPERCTGVVLADGIPMPRTPAPLRWLSTFALGRGVMKFMVKQLSFSPKALRRAFADPTRAPDGFRGTLAHTPKVQFDTFLNCMIAGDGPPTPQAPVLVVWGEQDHLPGISLASGKKLVEKLAGASLYFIADAGHFPQVEHWQIFVRAIERFAHLARPDWRAPWRARRWACWAASSATAASEGGPSEWTPRPAAVNRTTSPAGRRAAR